jgi:hypothetical protein
MQPVKINITTTLTSAEMFFLQKSIELLNKESIDTYRLRINNPKTLLREISEVVKLIQDGSIKENYGHALFKEALTLLKQEQELVYNSISKTYLQAALGKNELENVYYAANVLLKDNSGYAQKLYETISAEVTCLNGIPFNYQEFDRLNRIVGDFFIELRALGYSKEYLHNFIRSIFSPKKALPAFADAYTIIGSLINRPLEQFTVYIAIKIPGATDPKLLSTADFSHIFYTDLHKKAAVTSKALVLFADKNADWTFFTLEVECQDYLSAGLITRNRLQKKFDLFFMGFSSDEIMLNNNFFVVGANNPGRGKPQYFDYRLDGKFNSNIDTYNNFIANITGVNAKPLERVSMAKLQAGLRYLRLGSNAEELESKLLNYWIAIEYLFSSHDSSVNKTTRLQQYFNKIHSLSYATRIFQYLQKSVVRLSLDGKLSKYDAADLTYLTDAQTLSDAAALVIEHPLFLYRLSTVNNRFKDFQSITYELKRHQANIEHNLLRTYRIRNEIVHSAAKDKNIADITAHVKYYLIFIINGFIDFVLNHPVDVDMDGQISIDDYFIISKIKLESLMNDNSITLEKLLKFPNPIEYLG